MVKFIAEHENGRIILGLGITTKNIAKLKEGYPIHFNAEQINLPKLEINEVIIFFGETEEQIQKDFEEKGIIDKSRIKVDKGDKH